MNIQFKSADNSLKLYDKLYFESKAFQVDGKIVKMEPFRLITYKCDEDFPPKFWNKYNVEKCSVRLSGSASVPDFGVSKWNLSENKLDYYIGIDERNARGDITDTVVLDIPGGIYAIFETPPATYFDFVNTIHKTWDYIERYWLPENGFIRTGEYELESYTEESILGKNLCTYKKNV